MQSRRVLPPPPGALGVAELDVPDAPGERARLLWVVPPVENCVGNCWDDGATWGTCCAGGRRADDPAEGVMLDGGALVREPLLESAGMEVTGADGVAGRVAVGAVERVAEGAAERTAPEELRLSAVI
jgi:hypothetical protein